jgi:cytochrome c-type biogenesis protein CcmI
MNEVVVVAAIGVVAAVFILRPLLRGRGAAVRPTAPRGSLNVAQPAGLVASEELAELELDRAMGRVSEEDFVKWRGEIEAGVTADDASPAAAADAEPTDSAAAPVAEPTDATARAEALVRRWSTVPRPSCPDCGVRPEPEARYCSNCGASLAS